MSAPRQLAAREGLGLPSGGTLDQVLARAPLLPSSWGGQDVVAAWARGGPEDADAVDRAVTDGRAERVWGPQGRLWLTTPSLAADLRVVYRGLADALQVDETLARRLRGRWPADASLTVGRAAGLLAAPRRDTGAALQFGAVHGWWRPTTRDDEGRLRFRLRDEDLSGDPVEAAARVATAVVAAAGSCHEDTLVARLGRTSVVTDGIAVAVTAGPLQRDGAQLRAPDAAPAPAGGLALLGRGDPFVRLADVDDATAVLRDGRRPPPSIVLDGRLVGVWSERWVRRSLHLDVALAGPFDDGHERALTERIASLGRLRSARRTRWRRLGPPHAGRADQ